jgi:hypothetical protein
MTMLETPSRILIASGGDKPVPDGFGGRISLFAKAFVDGLRTASRNTWVCPTYPTSLMWVTC